jgi:hypothetical protein
MTPYKQRMGDGAAIVSCLITLICVWKQEKGGRKTYHEFPKIKLCHCDFEYYFHSLRSMLQMLPWFSRGTGVK